MFSLFLFQLLSTGSPSRNISKHPYPTLRVPVDLSEGEILFLAAGPHPSEIRIDSPDNVDAADTTNTDQIQAGGTLGLDLTGNGYTVGIWEAGGYVRGTHDELDSRVVFGDLDTNPSDFSNHATHVAGTIGASGADSNAEGMATQVQIRS